MSPPNLNTPAVFCSAAATGTAAVLIFSVMPVLIGGFAEQFQLSDAQAGLIATSYFSSYALVALSCPLWVRRFDWRVTIFLAYIALILGTQCLALAVSYEQILISMAVAGLGAGILFPVSLTLAADTRRPERTYALKIMPEQLIPAAILLILAGLKATPGDYVITLAVGTLLLCALGSLGMPDKGLTTTRVSEAGTDVGWGVLGLIALAVSFAGYAGLWVFFERIATQLEFSDTFTQTWLAVGLVMSGIGPLFAAIYANRFGYAKPIIGGTLIAVTAMALLAFEIDKLRFAIVLIILPLAYYVMITYMMAVIAGVDKTGKISGLMSFALAIGAGVGPAAFGALNDAALSPLAIMIIGVGLGSVLILWVIQSNTLRQEQAE
jgi:predicted MFS family arabinose efflux permease